MGEFDQHLLTIITFFPLVTALGLMATSIIASALGASGLPATLWKPVALASTILSFLLSLRLFATFDPIANWLPADGTQTAGFPSTASTTSWVSMASA